MVVAHFLFPSVSGERRCKSKAFRISISFELLTLLGWEDVWFFFFSFSFGCGWMNQYLLFFYFPFL